LCHPTLPGIGIILGSIELSDDDEEDASRAPQAPALKLAKAMDEPA
jgi:hypothetical protein